MATETKAELRRVELMISTVLRVGVLICAFVIAAGLIGRMLRIGIAPGSSQELISTLVGHKIISGYTPPSRVTELVSGTIHAQSDTIIAAGLLLLIALPILRVAMTWLLFLAHRDWAFVLITSIVFAVLMSSIFFGATL